MSKWMERVLWRDFREFFKSGCHHLWLYVRISEGALKKCWCLGPNPNQLNHILWGQGLGIGIFCELSRWLYCVDRIENLYHKSSKIVCRNVCITLRGQVPVDFQRASGPKIAKDCYSTWIGIFHFKRMSFC